MKSTVMSRITTDEEKERERKSEKKTVACSCSFHFIQMKQISINEYYINKRRIRERGRDR